jgi:hypothetical protein
LGTPQTTEPRSPLGYAWVGLTLALALHVADEAAHDFLSVYNPAVTAIRLRFPFLPLPVFSFSVWLTGLILAVLALLALAPLAFRGNRWLVRLSYPFAGLMFANGLGHIAYSLYNRTLMPGVWSSPLLLAASVWLIISARRSPRVVPPAATPRD